MIKVLFVCLGNICRSPMAEAMFRELVKREQLEDKIIVDSAGTGNWHIGHPPHQGTAEILKKNNISVEGMKARQIEVRDIEEFDYIVAMDASNRTNIEKLHSSFPKAKIVSLLDFVQEIDNKDVPDPYFTGNFEEVYELVSQGCNELLNYIKVTHFN